MNEREIFERALDHVDPAERQAYLDRACGGDAALRARIEALLISHSSDTPFLKVPALEQLYSPAPAQAKTIAMNAHGGLDTVADETRPEDEVTLRFLAPARRPDSIGRIGHYEVLQVLGNGGFGVVFRAFDDVLHRVVAVKVLSPQMAAASPARKRFLREARSSAQVRHENVVQVYEVGEQPLPHLVMEFIPGETLQQRLDRTGPLDVPEVLRIGRQIAEGLAAAHATDLIHRDIKPGNVLLEGGTQKVKITDFSLARAADDASISQSGLVAGTPMYMAPEQAKGESLDQRADLFSLGSVLYQMVTGRPPFRANGTLAVLKRVAEDTPRPICEIIPETPQWLCDIISKLHAKKPEDRFQSAREVADLLGRCQAEIQRPGATPNLLELQPKAAMVPPAWDIPAAAPAIRRPRVHPRRWAAAAAAVLVMLFGVLGFTEATGITNVRGTVIRLFSPEGTLVVEVDDPGVIVKIDGSDVVIIGAGVKEIRLKPGRYTVEGIKDGKIVAQELVTVTNNGKQVVRVSQEAAKLADAAQGEKSVAAMPPAQQVSAVATRLQELNPGFDGDVTPDIEDGVVKGFAFNTDHVMDISPVIAMNRLRVLRMDGSNIGKGKLTDLSPLKGMNLVELNVRYNPVKNLTPLQGMPLKRLDLWAWVGADLTPLNGMPLEWLNCGDAGNKLDLTPLAGLPLEYLCVNHTQVSDLTPLANMPLKALEFTHTNATDFSPLEGIKTLERINLKPAAVFFDRCAAEYVPSIGGTVRVDGDDREIKTVAELPERAFRLTAIDLVRNQKVTDAGLAIFKSCKNLMYLDLRFTQVGDAGLANFKNCKNLTFLDLNATKVGDVGLANFKDCANLTNLSLPHTAVTDAGLAVFKAFKNLTYLDLNGCPKASDAGLVAFNDCKNLRFLGLSGTGVTDASLAQFKDCKNLTVLNLDDTQVTDAGLAHLKGWKSLNVLSLRRTKVTDAGLVDVKDCKNLTELALDGTPITDAALAQFKDCKDLKSVSIKNTKVTDLSLLKGTALKRLNCDFKPERDTEILRSIKTLEKINDKPAAKFWEGIAPK